MKHSLATATGAESLVSALRQHCDLHVGWKPDAPVQHLCTGTDDLEVPPAQVYAAAERWGVKLLKQVGKGHSDGIAQCHLIALSNMTASAAAMEAAAALPDVSNTSSLPPYFEGGDASIPALLDWHSL